MTSLVPITLAEANEFVRRFHRHHGPVIGSKFAIGLYFGSDYAGVAIVGRPVARAFDNGITAEVTRLCTDGRLPNVASKLYAACWRACRAMGYQRLITYTLASEKGTSVRAAGWREVYATKDRPKGWDTPSRPRIVKAPTEAKTLWEMTA